MVVSKLIEAYKKGAFKMVGEACKCHETGMSSPMPLQDCDGFIRMIGWLEWAQPRSEIMDKTSKMVKSIASNVTSSEFLNNTEVTFQNRRLQETIKYFDRICMVNPKFNIVILRGMPGTGGAYAVYDANSYTHQPIFNCRSLKQLGEYLNELI